MAHESSPLPSPLPPICQSGFGSEFATEALATRRTNTTCAASMPSAQRRIGFGECRGTVLPARRPTLP